MAPHADRGNKAIRGEGLVTGHRRFGVEIIVNAETRQVAEAITVAALLEELRLAGKLVAVEVNLELVPRQRHAQQRLAAGDRVEIVTLVGGG
jgi:sulfur carrier protein